MKINNYIQHISKTLLYAYRIQPSSLVSDNIHVRKTTNLDETEEWVKNSLLNLDEKLADSVMPILVERFEDHLRNIGVIDEH